jgi:hypothetical protein
MLKSFCKVLGFFLVSVLNQGGDLTWRWSNPLPHGMHILGMAAGAGWVVQVGDRGQVYVSHNLDQWTPKETSTSKSLRSVVFFGTQVIIAGEEGLILQAASPGPSHPFQKIPLSTADWLEGITASPDLLVAVGDNGAIYTSSNGLEWQRHPQPFNDWLRSVAYGSGRFVAVGEDGFIATSQDGASWQPVNSGVTSHLNSVAWIGNEFVAVGDQGTVVLSSQGLQWQQAISGATANLNTASGFPGTLLVAGQGEVRLRHNGVWSNQIQAPGDFPAPSWTYLSSFWDGSIFLLGGRSGKLIEGFQPSPGAPYVWVDRFESLRNWMWDALRTPGFYLTVGDRATVMTSEDGIHWEIELVPATLLNAIFLGTGGSPDLFLAVGNRGQGMISSNGVVWEAVTFPTQNDLQGVAYRNGVFVVTGGNGTILTSSNGRDWTLRNSGVGTFLSSVAASPSGFVAVGSGGTILTSPDGAAWTQRNSNTSAWIYRVRFLEGQFLAVGQNGLLLSSSNSATWATHSTGTTRWLNDIAYSGGSYYIAGMQGTILSSPDALNWVEAKSPSTQSLFALATHQGQIIASGVEGAILRAQALPFESPVEIHSFRRPRGHNLFLFTGQPDQRFVLEGSQDLVHWIPRAELELSQGESTLLYLEPQQDNAPHRFFRTRAIP